MTQDERFRRVLERIRELESAGEIEASPDDESDLERLAAVRDGAIDFDALDDATYRRLIDAIGLEGVADALVPAEVWAVAAGRSDVVDVSPGLTASSRQFAAGWPDLDETLAAIDETGTPVPPAGADAAPDLPFDLHRADLPEGGIVLASLWIPREGDPPVLVHRFRPPNERTTVGWTLYLSTPDARSDRPEAGAPPVPFGLWAQEADGGFRFDVLIHRQPTGAVVLGVTDRDGELTTLWADRNGDGLVDVAWRRAPTGSWVRDEARDVPLLADSWWTDRQREAALALKRVMTD